VKTGWGAREDRDLGTAEKGRAFLEGGGAQFLGHETLYHKSRRPCQHTNVVGTVRVPKSRRREEERLSGGRQAQRQRCPLRPYTREVDKRTNLGLTGNKT
jgi:hypothetical protein